MGHLEQRAGLARFTQLTISCTILLCIPVQAESISYKFTKLAALGDSAGHRTFHINDFEPGAINNRGDVIYGTDLGTSTDPASFFGEGVFLRGSGQAELELARGFTNAPGGGIFDFLLLGQIALNDPGDAAFAFALTPLDLNAAPFGLNSGVYRYSHDTGKVTAVVKPYSTRAPGGGTFAGVGFNTRLNNRGDLVFTGIAATHAGTLANGVYKADASGRITSVVSPGDSAPGGGSFDSVFDGWINQAGDVAFDAHLAAETGTQSGRASLYLKHAGTGRIDSIAHAGDAAPGGSVFRSVYSPVLNDSGDIAFLGDISTGPPSNGFENLGVYVHSKGKTLVVAKPGDSMPGGGKFVTASFLIAENVHVNNAGDVVFNAKLDTDANRDGFPDTGLYVWSHGELQLVARTGTVIPGVGTVGQLVMGVFSIPVPASYVPNSGAINNDRGQVLFGATLSNGQAVLLVATPHGED
ncbi:MAG: hypothetical protein JWP63_3499 [Candidatus Solibacter sp.]|nr:hypothetical protein [Candidatus Solibacter sp.]